MPMSDDTVYKAYLELVDQLSAILRPLTMMPLRQMATANERMQTVAPFFVAPIQYHSGARNLQEQRRVIDAAAALQDVLFGLTGAPPREEQPA
ncbi:hypothetical protein K1W54_38160 [Micromonospora sp. CPCC 205371]|nr:hypothetical protein [Micromonospora sp. CPCC 205371]